MAEGSAAPVTFETEYPERLSRGWLLAKTFLGVFYVGIPHGIILWLLGIVALLVGVVAFFAILFTGRYPRGLFNFVVGYNRWSARVNAYMGLMVDNYPPFSLGTVPSNPVTLDIEYPEKLSRGLVLLKLLFGWLYVIIPHGIALLIYGIGAIVATIIAWFAILFTGRFPRGMFTFIEGYMRWELRVNAYMSFLRDEYPPFHGRP